MKEGVKQELSFPFQNSVNNESNEGHAFYQASAPHESPFSPIHWNGVGVAFPPRYYNPNVSYPGFNNPTASTTGYKFSNCYPIGGSPLLVPPNGNNSPPLVYRKRFPEKVFSPEHKSSVTMNSDSGCSPDNEPLELGATFAVRSFSEPIPGSSDWIKPNEFVENNHKINHVGPQSLLGDNLELHEYKAWLSGHNSMFIPEDTNALSGTVFNQPKLSHEWSSNFEPQAHQSNPCHLQSCPPPAHFDGSLERQMYGCSVVNQKFQNEVSGESSLVLSRPPLAPNHRSQQHGFSNVQASKTTSSRGSVHRLLVLYLIFRSKQLDVIRSQQEYVDYLHLVVCRGLDCKCNKYRALVSHFDNCQTTDCKICGPVHQIFHNKKIKSVPASSPYSTDKMTTVSENPRGCVIGNPHPRDFTFQETQPDPKRLKIEAVPRDDWSLSSVVLSCSELQAGCLLDDEENTAKMNKELLSSNEGSPGVIWNGDADNGGPETETICFSMTDGLLGLGQSSEDPRNSAALNNVALSHSEEFNFVDKHQELDCDNTGNIKCDVTSSCQSLNSDGISILPEEPAIDPGEETTLMSVTENVCFSKTDGLLGLGQSSEDPRNSAALKNVTLSHSEGFNLVDKHQEMDCDNTSNIKCDVTFSCQSLDPDGVSILPEEPATDPGEKTKIISVAEHDRIDTNCDSSNSDYQYGTKLEELKGSGVSLTDAFTAEQIKMHLDSLRQCTIPNAEKELSGDKTAQTAGANSCQLCLVDVLAFAGPPMYCSWCQLLIKHKLNYYWATDESGTQYCFCNSCFSHSRGGRISSTGGLTFSKAKLQKAKNTTELDEPCDKCERWQHQVCALYNSKRDLEGKVDYICPKCRLAEIEAKKHVPIPPATGARDLPRTKLSDHIEQRLLRSLEHERKQRAELIGKSPEEVPGAADLVVRVVLAVNKQLEVKQEFLDIIPGESYPTKFSYKSKVILLFQKVECVDVCLFSMYVQEYGSDCGNPNKRSIYISYLDSVKYFTPEIKTVAGVALRTIVYHEILIGYLDYCKQYGFKTCYIWACPPRKGEDYILYCHPETQKRPDDNRLSQWYKKMLKKAKQDNVVVEYTNFYEHFFIPSGECNSKITAARLPYFDGDYWSGEIEHHVRNSEKNEGGDSERKLKTQMTRRTLKAMGHTDTTEDVRAMQELGAKIHHKKDDFFVVHLQFICTNCNEAILSGSRWSCNQCSKFHLCSRCFELKKTPDGLETLKTCRGKKHQLWQIAVSGVAADTEDNDVILHNEFLDNRHSFLDFCQKNNYQFDSLRRAKYSSMMILHHLHKMSTFTTQTICSICHHEPVVRWHCEICSEFHACNACYQKEGDRCHIHKLVQQSRKADCRTNTEHIQQQGQLKIRWLLNVLEHANQCGATKDNPCTYPNCHDMKILFLHGAKCQLRLPGGCRHCRRIWFLLDLHSKICRISNCGIPRCMDIKRHKQMIATQSDLQRRALLHSQV
ncbi:hypothetical protein ABFS82_08G040200 [Erythranthe guttata]